LVKPNRESKKGTAKKESITQQKKDMKGGNSFVMWGLELKTYRSKREGGHKQGRGGINGCSERTTQQRG